ncbi:hypothetical protein ACTMSW_29565, partial [Micromonospora sp. BQ11]|uniref:hypothetical protein n=1 Tax=Micromonospora sp. BQ11 TaxID=3452212 RepID=UPI003F895B39
MTWVIAAWPDDRLWPVRGEQLVRNVCGAASATLNVRLSVGAAGGEACRVGPADVVGPAELLEEP